MANLNFIPNSFLNGTEYLSQWITVILASHPAVSIDDFGGGVGGVEATKGLCGLPVCEPANAETVLVGGIDTDCALRGTFRLNIDVKS